MRSTATHMKKPNREDEAPDSSANLNSPAQPKSTTFSNENDWMADFVVGALLYSLLDSRKGEAIRGLLPDGENN